MEIKNCICCGAEFIPTSLDYDDNESKFCEGCIKCNCPHTLRGSNCLKPRCKEGQLMDLVNEEWVCTDDNCDCSLDNLDELEKFGLL